MKIFIDTNIFLDLILKRDSYKEALWILNSIERKLFDGVILDITILNIDYIAKKQTKNIRAFLESINDLFFITGANNKNMKKALILDNTDLEDNLQYVVAKESKCSIIISNDKNFIKQDIKVVSSKQFCEEYIK